MNYQIWLETSVAIINIHILLIKLFSGKLRKTGILFLIFVVLPLCILTVFQNLDFVSIINVFTLPLIFITPLITVKNVPKRQIFYITLFFYGFSNAMTTIFVWIASSLQASQTILSVIDIAINLLLLTLCILMAKKIILPKFAQQIMLIGARLKVLLVAAIWFSVLAAYLLSELFYRLPNEPILITVQIISAILIIAIGIMVPLLIVNNISSAYYKNIADNFERQMQMQLKHYETLARADSEMRRFKHDFKNLRIALSDSLDKNDVAGALAFLKDSENYTSPRYIIFDTGNPVADALLTEKYHNAEAAGAKIIFDGMIPNSIVQPADICVILGNSLDNAIEACAQIPGEKTISVYSYMNNGFYFLTVRNPTLKDVVINGSSIPTSKKEKESHGFGLYSIQNAAEKYGGEMTLSSADREFKLEVYLDLNMMNEQKSAVLTSAGQM